MKTLRALLIALIPAIALASSTFNIFNPGPSGLVKSNGTSTLQAATGSDITGLLTCSSGVTCSAGSITGSGGGSSAITCTTACTATGLAVGQELWIYKGTATNYTTQVGTGDGDLKVTSMPIGKYIFTALLNVTGPTTGTLQGNLLTTGTTNGTSQCLLFIPTATGVQTGINTGSFSYNAVGATGVATNVSTYTCTLNQTGVANVQFFFFNSNASQTSTVQAGSWISVKRVL